VLPPELMMNNLGYQLMGDAKMDEAIRVFKNNIERYPNSANVYDSLAEAYEKNGKIELPGRMTKRPSYWGGRTTIPICRFTKRISREWTRC
jgi:predicted Zn-dependent protease